MKTTKEEIFRIKGKIAATFTEKTYPSAGNIKLIITHFNILNKEELNELIDWLISKMDEM